MLEHLSNCHGEWNFILAMIASLPFIGVWLKAKIQSFLKRDSDETQ